MKQSFGLKPSAKRRERGRALRLAGGPGSGKTDQLVQIYSDLLMEEEPAGARVLFLTATEPAAWEVRRRVEAVLGRNQAQSWILTFQRFAELVMREDPDLAFASVVTAPQAHLVMRQVLAGLDPGALGAFADLAQSDRLTADCLRIAPWLRAEQAPPSGLGSLGLRVALAASAAYWERLRAAGLCDFREIPALAREVLERRAEVGIRFQFTHVLIDEFQDLDRETLAVLSRIAPPESGTRVVVAADPDQSIFSFRGADPIPTLDQFDRLWEPEVLNLEARTRAPGLTWAARAVLDCARGEAGKPALRADSEIRAVALPDARSEAEFIAGESERLLEGDPGLRAEEMAVVVRQESWFDELLGAALDARAIPHRRRRALMLTRNRLASYLLDCLESLARPGDPTALDRVLSSELSGVGPILASRLRELALARSQDLIPALDSVLSHRMDDHGLAAEEVERLGRAARARRERLARAGRVTLVDLTWSILGEPGMLGSWLEMGAGGEGERLARETRAWVTALAELERVWRALNGSPPTLAEVFPWLRTHLAESLPAADLDQPETDAGGVAILSVHEAKGLNFRVVFAAAMSRDVFPLPAPRVPILERDDVALLPAGRRLPPWAQGPESRLEEEARMAYVALSRATERLYVTCADRYEEASGPSLFWQAVARVASPESFPAPADSEAYPLTPWQAEAALAGAELTEAQRESVARLDLDLPFIQDPAERERFRPEIARPSDVSVEAFSATALNTYLSCPRKYWYERHPGWFPSPRATTTELGEHLHRVFEDFHRQEQRWSGIPLEDRRRWLWERHRELAAGYLESLGDSLERKVRQSYLDVRVGRFIEGLLSADAPLAQRTLATELEFQVALAGHQVRGKIDRVALTNAGIEVIDYKTGADVTLGEAHKRYFGEDLHDVQLVAYHLACREGVDAAGRPLDLDPALLSLWYPAAQLKSGMRRLLFTLKGEVPGHDRRQQRALGESELERGRKVMLEAIEGILAGDFSPRPRPVAGTCLSRAGCPAAAVCPKPSAAEA